MRRCVLGQFDYLPVRVCSGDDQRHRVHNECDDDCELFRSAAVAFFFCKVDFSKAWTFLGISNQILATIVLWTGAAYLISKGKKHLMCSLPAAFLTYVCVSYLLVAPHDKAGLHLSPELGNYIGMAVAVILFSFCLIKGRKARRNRASMQDISCE